MLGYSSAMHESASASQGKKQQGWTRRAANMLMMCGLGALAVTLSMRGLSQLGDSSSSSGSGTAVADTKEADLTAAEQVQADKLFEELLVFRDGDLPVGVAASAIQSMFGGSQAPAPVRSQRAAMEIPVLSYVVSGDGLGTVEHNKLVEYFSTVLDGVVSTQDIESYVYQGASANKPSDLSANLDWIQANLADQPGRAAGLFLSLVLAESDGQLSKEERKRLKKVADSYNVDDLELLSTFKKQSRIAPAVEEIMAGDVRQGEPNPPGSMPNIIILLADDVGYGDLGFMGNPDVETPNLDRMAAEGMHFLDWYTSFYLCSPSRSSLMTGRIPLRFGVSGEWVSSVFDWASTGGLPQTETTLARLLKNAHGYKTGVFGKWHMGQLPQYLPLSHGFDEFLGVPVSSDTGSSQWMQAIPAAMQLPPLPLMDGFNVIQQPFDLSTGTKRITDRTVDFIERSVQENTPFFIFVSYMHAHYPHFVSEDHCNKSPYGRIGDVMAEMDESVGRVLDALIDNGVDSNTLTFFISDNGPVRTTEQYGRTLGMRGGKRSTYEGGIRMPAVAHWPGRIEPGSVSRALITSMDIFPTVAALTETPLPEGKVIDGQDISNVLFATGEQVALESAHDCLFYYAGTPGLGKATPQGDPCTSAQQCPGLWAMRCGRYKVHFVTLETPTTHVLPWPEIPPVPLVYDILSDPEEKVPVSPIYDTQKYQNIMQSMMMKLGAHQATMEIAPVSELLKPDNPQAAVCCNPLSQQQYPNFPPCTCNPEVFEQGFVCQPLCDSFGICFLGGILENIPK